MDKKTITLLVKELPIFIGFFVLIVISIIVTSIVNHIFRFDHTQTALLVKSLTAGIRWVALLGYPVYAIVKAIAWLFRSRIKK